MTENERLTKSIIRIVKGLEPEKVVELERYLEQWQGDDPTKRKFAKTLLELKKGCDRRNVSGTTRQ